MQIGRADEERVGGDRGGILAGGVLPVGQRESSAALEPDPLREVVVVIDGREYSRARTRRVVDGVARSGRFGVGEDVVAHVQATARIYGRRDIDRRRDAGE